MTNYTERLKKYWKSKDLEFVATFKRIDSSLGVFKKLMNTNGNMQIYYPTLGDIDVGFSGVQFYYKTQELEEGNYVIQLEFKDNSQSNRNPYSLQITAVNEIDSNLNELYEKSKQEPNLLIGRYKEGKNSFSYFDCIKFKSNNEKFLNNGNNQNVYVSPKYKLVNNQYYSFYINENVGKLPNAIRATIIEVENYIHKTKDDSSEYNRIIFYGRYSKKNEKFACFENVMSSETGEILMFQGESQKVYVSPNLDLKQGSYYQFTFIESEGKLPSAIINSIKSIGNPYKELIEERFRLHNNPASNKANAKTMREIGIGMYSSKERMIYELLQNADDSPGKEKVEFHIDINGDYFFIMHDGAPFDKKDVKAITSAGESTKEKSKNKTGYKGIGFKSVFTNSTEVWIKSGGYQFAFLKNSELFNDFESLYFSDERRAQFTEEGLRIEQERFLEQKEGFDSALHIPWQLMPIWQEQLPQDFDEANFDKFNNPVQIALRLGKNNIKDYKKAIDNITKRPQFLLFLRNTSKFNSRKNGVMVLRKDHYDNVIEILRLKGEENETYHYTKQIFNDIVVSDKAFELSGIGLKKKSEFNESTKAVNNYFVDLDENRLDEIPPKLASVNQTEISFAIKIVNQKIVSEEGYLNNSQNYSSLFTYLPMEDKRLILPFLVNADFVPDSRRENLQYSNPWNKYIMIKVAEKHVATLAHFAQEFLKDKDTNSSYLSLLLKNPLPEDDTAQQIIESYNAKYLEQLENTEIVINDNDEIQLLSNTIIDDSGLIKLFGNAIFYNVIDTKKRLPHFILDAKYLKDYKYLNVEVIDLKQIAEQITPEICVSLGWIIKEKSLYGKEEVLDWLNKLVKYIPGYFGKIPFIVHNNALFSLERLIEEKDAWLINEHTSQYATLIEELGYHTIQLNLDKYSNIKEFLHSINGYINDKALAYERIASNANIHKLPVTSKLNVIDFFQNSAFMVGIGVEKYFGKLKLFIDENDNPRPIWQLLSRDEDLEVNSIDNFRIKETEFNNLTDDLQKQLIAKDAIFTSFILNKDLFKEWSKQFATKNINNYVSDLKTMYSWIDNPDDISIAQWASTPWLYIDDEVRFETSVKVYWSKAFKDLSADKFEIIKTVFQTAELKTLPVQECGELIKAFPIKTDDSSEIDWSEVEELEVPVANTLLDWMEDDGSFGDFFKNYTLVPSSNNSYNIEQIEDVQIFDGSNKDLTAYIQSNTELSLIFNELDKNLCSENRSMISLLKGDRLIKALIETGEFNQNLALHLPSNVSSELLHNFIANLKEFKLFTSSDYGGDTPEHFIISRLLKDVESIIEISPALQNTIETLRSKASIDGNPLSNYTVNDRVSFGPKEDRKVLKLSDILTEFQGESDVLENVKESFTSITQKAKLRELIFKTIPLTPKEIYTRIESENSIYYTVYQVVFQLLDKKYGGNRNWSKQRFDEYFIEHDSENKLHNSYGEILDALIELQLTEISDFKFQDLKLENCVDKSVAIESERIANWLEEWINIKPTERLEFLTKLGYNGKESSIVILREALINENYNADLIVLHYSFAKKNIQVIWNTIKWLSSFSSLIITRNIELIKKINNYVSLSTENLVSVTIPIIEGINNENIRMYTLKSIECNSKLYFLPENELFEHAIFSEVKKVNHNWEFIDVTIGNLSKYFQVQTITLKENINYKLLEDKSNLWDEQFYKKWEFYNEYPIYIYNGENIPYLRAFNDIIVNDFSKDLSVADNGKYFVSKKVSNDVIKNLPESFPEEKRSSLIEWENKTLKNPDILEIEKDLFNEITPDDEIFIRGIIKGDFELTDQLDANTTAKIKTLMAIRDRYNINEISDEGRHLKAGSDEIIVRSAQSGLMYLDLFHWERLKENNVKLAVYTNNEISIYDSQENLIQFTKPQNKFGILRMPNNYSLEDYNSFSNIHNKGEWKFVFIVNENTKTVQNYKSIINLDDYNF